ncbi:putative Ubiquitin carboxyl terminal hydrolase [Trypanosoma vivax]|nr:putative Ubiquitin carboxyl terminal hydrolase [Trypanosoma vivax]
MSCSFIGRLNGCDFHRSFVKRWLSPGTQGKEKLRCLLCHSNAPADRLPSAKGQEGIKAQSANKNVGARTKHEEDAQIYLAVCLYCASCFCKKHESNHNTCDASGPGGERNDVERHPLFLRVYCDLLGCGTHSSDRRQPNPLPQLKMKNGTAIRENSTIKMSAIEDLQVQSSKDSPSPVIACLKCDKTSSQNVSHGTPAAKVEHYSDTLSNLKKPIYLYIMNVCVEDSSDDVEAGRYHLGISGSATTHGNATHFYSHPNEHHSVRSTQAVAPVHRIHPHKVGPQVLFEAKLVGLENPHNICYFNAVLQCVLKCHSFTEWISNVECSKVGILAEHMHKLVRRFNMSKTAQKWEEVKEHVYAIRSHLGEITPMFADDDQQDSQELFLSMINGVADEFDKLTPEKKEKLPPFPFKGVLLNEVRCLGCDNCAARKETFMALSIPVEETLTKGLSKVFEKVKLTDKDKYACEACFKALEPCAQRENNEATKLSNSNEKKKNPAAELKSLDCVYTDAEVQTNISEMGGILVVHLLRFHFNGKISTSQTKR